MVSLRSVHDPHAHAMIAHAVDVVRHSPPPLDHLPCLAGGDDRLEGDGRREQVADERRRGHFQVARNSSGPLAVWDMSWWDVASGAVLCFAMAHVDWTPRQPATVAAPLWHFTGSNGLRLLGGAPVARCVWCASVSS